MCNGNHCPPPVLYTIPVLVDSKVNLENSGVLIPDGMLAKVAGSNQFKVGQGDKTWNELEYINDKFSNLQIISDNITIFVNSNTGSDVISEERGFSENTPFKSVQAAIDFISGNFKISNSWCSLKLAPGDYTTPNGRTIIKPLLSTYGSLGIYGDENDSSLVKIDPIYNTMSAKATIGNLTICPKWTTKVAGNSCVYTQGRDSDITLVNVIFDLSNSTGNSISHILQSYYHSRIAFANFSSNIVTRPNKIIAPTYSVITFAYASYYGDIVITLPIEFTNTLNVSGECINSYLMSYINVSNATWINESNVIGKRYYVGAKSWLRTGGNGPEFIPGTIAGIVESSESKYS